MFYYADEFPGGPPDFKAVAYINGPRAIYMTDVKILGANYGLDLLIPFYYGEVEVPKTPAGKIKDSTFTMGDLQFEPLLLAWHYKQWDIGAEGPEVPGRPADAVDVRPQPPGCAMAVSLRLSLTGSVPSTEGPSWGVVASSSSKEER